MSLSELSEQALDETLYKYSAALQYNFMSWEMCKICTEIDTLKIPDIKSGCKYFCPLYPSRWCRNAIQNSRLYKQDTQLNAWKTDVNNYLWWITTELELRRTKYERKWGGAW